MARTGIFVEALTSYYGNLANDTLGLLRSTQEDLRTGNFDYEKTLGKALSLWLDSAEGWWSALLVNASAPVPTIFLRIGQDDTTHVQVARVSVPGDRPAEWTDLSRLGGSGTIDRKHVSVEVAKHRDSIEVKLFGLGDLRRNQTIAPGLYQGLVHIHDRPLAIVLVEVLPPVGDKTSG